MGKSADKVEHLTKKCSKIRLDQSMVERGLASCPDQAKRLIMAGSVLIRGQKARFSGELIMGNWPVEVIRISRYVGRGGDKLAGALQHFNLNTAVSGKVALDVGASTGGFTDCALQLGAREVVAVDVGFNQLAWRLRTHDRVKVFEQTDIRNFKYDNLFDFVFMDVSFNSAHRLLPSAARHVLPEGHLIVLVKPQFELPKDSVPKGGVVTSKDDHARAVELASKAGESLGFAVREVAPAQIRGQKGNQEFFIWFSRLGS